MDKLEKKDQEIVWQKFVGLIREGFDISVYEYDNYFEVAIVCPFCISNIADTFFYAIDGLLENIDSLRENKEPVKTNQYWQLCPKCMGENEHVCNVCNGEKIISMLNGQPPSKQ